MAYLETTITIATREIDVAVEFGLLRGRSASRHSPPEATGAVITSVRLFKTSGEELNPIPPWLSQLLEEDPDLCEKCLGMLEDTA
jgi:hypothetical protein